MKIQSIDGAPTFLFYSYRNHRLLDSASISINWERVKLTDTIPSGFVVGPSASSKNSNSESDSSVISCAVSIRNSKVNLCSSDVHTLLEDLVQLKSKSPRTSLLLPSEGRASDDRYDAEPTTESKRRDKDGSGSKDDEEDYIRIKFVDLHVVYEVVLDEVDLDYFLISLAREH